MQHEKQQSTNYGKSYAEIIKLNENKNNIEQEMKKTIDEQQKLIEEINKIIINKPECNNIPYSIDSTLIKLSELLNKKSK